MDPLQTLSDVIAQMDAVVSFAIASVSAPVPFVRPHLLAESGCRRMELLQARHPCMEMDADTAFIPNDVTFIQDEKSFYIITGENGASVSKECLLKDKDWLSFMIWASQDQIWVASRRLSGR